LECWRLALEVHSEDRLVVVSLVLTIGGIIIGALLAEPRLYGVTALVVIGILIAGAYVTRRPGLAVVSGSSRFALVVSGCGVVYEDEGVWITKGAKSREKHETGRCL
jgi:hypothetical protein